MWTCPKCQKAVEAQYDLCAGCGSNPSGEIDPLTRSAARLRKRLLIALLLSPILYVASYFLLPTHTTGFTFRWSGGTSKQYTYHDRGFPFDPWIYQPLAKMEYLIRGPDNQIVIEDGRYRGGQPIYGFGPFE